MFRLLIECTKDIDKLQIDFSDGTSVIQTKPENKESKVQKTKKDHKNSALDLDSVFGEISQEVIEKPEIKDIVRGVKVASELQNFNL